MMSFIVLVLALIALSESKLIDQIKITRVDHKVHSPASILAQKYPGRFLTQGKNVSGTECGVCINAAVIEINLLLNQILNGVIVSDCSQLCNYLAPEGQYAVDACDLACMGLGIDEFINFLINEDIDPIWYCQILDLCSIDDCQGDCIDIPMYITQPNKIPQGGVVQQYFTVWVKKNWTGTGMFRFIVNDPVQGSQESDSLLDGGIGPIGKVTYGIQIPTAEAQLTPNVTIQTQVLICNGECGSSHPNSRVFADASTTFTIIPSSNADDHRDP